MPINEMIEIIEITLNRKYSSKEHMFKLHRVCLENILEVLKKYKED
jgi:hypothetical protein